MGKIEDNCRELERQRQDVRAHEENLRRAYNAKQVRIVKEIIDEIIVKLNDGFMPQICFLQKVGGVEYATIKIFDHSCQGEKGDRAFLLSNGNTYLVRSYDYDKELVEIEPEELCRLTRPDIIKDALIKLVKDNFDITIKPHWTNLPTDKPEKKSLFEKLFG